MRNDTVAIVICLLATLRAKVESSPGAIITKVHELKEKGVDIGEIYFYRTAMGYESPDIRSLLSCLYLEKFLSKEHVTVLITPAGLKEFRKMIVEFYKIDSEAVSQIADGIGIELSEIGITDKIP